MRNDNRKDKPRFKKRDNKDSKKPLEKLTRQMLANQKMTSKKMADQGAEARELPEDVLIGRNAVTEALRAGRGINKILLADGDREGQVSEIVALAKERGIVLQFVERGKIVEKLEITDPAAFWERSKFLVIVAD